MSSLDGDSLELLELLAKHGVRALVIGGHAVGFHGWPRHTADVDVLYDRSEDNCARLYAALVEFWGEPVPMVEGPGDLGIEGEVLMFGRKPRRIDLMNRMGSVPFDEAWAGRIEGPLPVPFVGLSELLRAKRDAGRPKDLADLDMLVQITGVE